MGWSQLVGDHHRRHEGQREPDADDELQQRRDERAGDEGPSDEGQQIDSAPDRKQDPVAEEPRQHVGVAHRRDLGQRLERGGGANQERAPAEHVDLEHEEVLRRGQGDPKKQTAGQESQHGHGNPANVKWSANRWILCGTGGRRLGLDRTPDPKSDHGRQRRVDKRNQAHADSLVERSRGDRRRRPARAHAQADPGVVGAAGDAQLPQRDRVEQDEGRPHERDDHDRDRKGRGSGGREHQQGDSRRGHGGENHQPLRLEPAVNQVGPGQAGAQ